jgi:hypothetical protein
MFSVSRNVVARRAFDAGRIEPRAYWEMVERWRREFQHASPRGGHPDYMTTFVSHRGRPFIAKVLDAMDAGVITKHEASQLLSLRPGHIEEAREHIAAR